MARLARVWAIGVVCWSVGSSALGLGHQDDWRRELPEARAFKHPGEIIVTYDRFKDETKVEVSKNVFGPLRAPGDTETPVELSAFLSYKGRTATAVPFFVSWLVSATVVEGDARFRGVSMDLAVLADGVPIRFYDTNTYSPHYVGGRVLYATGATLRWETFVSIVKAAKVEGRWFGQEFLLTEPQMEALRDLASRLR